MTRCSFSLCMNAYLSVLDQNAAGPNPLAGVLEMEVVFILNRLGEILHLEISNPLVTRLVKYAEIAFVFWILIEPVMDVAIALPQWVFDHFAFFLREGEEQIFKACYCHLALLQALTEFFLLRLRSPRAYQSAYQTQSLVL